MMGSEILITRILLSPNSCFFFFKLCNRRWRERGVHVLRALVQEFGMCNGNGGVSAELSISEPSRKHQVLLLRTVR
jgi:hypothetical protein